ncbi:FtsX-like permease family protein [Flavobacteriaceae bacterium R38]|nr:FtsX-like permease family protein [Flavobacteriaceae bacterium R38]
MLKHNLILFFRDIKKYKTAFLINIIGLSSGLACAFLIYLWVSDEVNMDRFNENDSARHVQVIHSYPTAQGIHTNTNGSTPNPLWEALDEEMPEVEYAFPAITKHFYNGVLSSKDKHFKVKPQFIGKGYFNVFSYNFTHGNKHEVLSDKSEIVISEKMATSLFQSADDAMGKTVTFKGQYFTGAYIISGVFKSPSNISEQFDVFFAYELFLERDLMQWYNGGTQAHLVLNKGVDLDKFNAKIKSFLNTKFKSSEQTLYAQPYSERYLYSKYENGVPVGGRIIYVKLFSIVALFVLVIACINYMNFSTAKASRRIKEIGVKKAIGAGRKSLIFKFFGESVSMAFLSLVIALVFVLILLPQFNEITGKQLTLNLAPNVIVSILTITAVTGLISGIYPAFHLSGFKPVIALKGKLTGDLNSFRLRKGLVVFQFAISVILIASVIVIYKQVEFIQTTNLGYNKDHIISFPKEGKLEKDFDAFLSEVKNIPGVLNASQMRGDLPGRIDFTHGYQWKDMDEKDLKLRFYHISGGYDLIELLGITLKDGRGFSRDFSTDEDAIIMNETAIKMINYENPVGEQFYNNKMSEIVGVVEDFHFQSLQEKVQPFLFSLSDRGDNFLVKMQAGEEAETIHQIAALYSKFNAGYPFEFKFLDENYQEVYASEERIAVLSKYFAGVAILISCLGLLGLAIFTASQRRKEIGIRKTLGQKRSQIAILLSGEFTKLVGISMIIGLPVAFLLMGNWLSNFAYKIALKPSYFIITGIITLLLAIATVSTQAINAASKNPVDALREE